MPTSVTVAESLRQAQTQGLARVDAQILLLHSLQRPLHDRAWLLAHDGDTLTAAQTATFATVSWVKPFGGYHSWNTRSMLGGSGNTATLTVEGNRMLALMAGDF